MFTSASTKFSIGSLDDADLEVDAQFNPKELQFDRSITWNPHKATHHQNKEANQEFGGANPETVKIDLLFDGYENQGCLQTSGNETVEDRIRTLRQLAAVRSPNSRNSDERRPHFCVATWGAGKKSMPRFECVIESISVKYQAFANDGTILRATVTIGLKSCERLSSAAATKDAEAREQRRFARQADRANTDRRTAEAMTRTSRDLTDRGRTFDRTIKNDDGTYGTWRYKTMNEQ